MDKERKQYATSAFARYEHYLRDSTLYAGLGIADRIPDFWEVSKVDGMYLSKETNTQLDIGLSHQKEGLSANVSGFISYVQDYIC